MPITYRSDAPISAQQLSDVFRKSTIRRPHEDLGRMARMIEQADVIVTAWDGERLVGVARSLSDFAFCTYLSDLAVDLEYQHQGIGRELVRLSREAVGEESMLLLLAAPEAVDYYPKLGMEPVASGWIYHRTR